MRISRAACGGLLALGLALEAPLAHAQAISATSADMRCLIVVATLAGSNSNPQIAAALPMMLGYYIGRIKGREPGIELEPRLMQEFRDAQGKDIRPEAARCSAEMSSLSKETAGLAIKFRSLAADPKTP